MAWNRFMELQTYIHVEDTDNIISNDKLYKAFPLTDTMNNILLKQFGIFSEHLSIDE